MGEFLSQVFCGGAFCKRLGSQWFTYPYILIQVERTGRLSEPELASYNKFDSDQVTKRLQKSVGQLMSGAAVGKIYYDQASRVIWYKVQATYSNVGKISGMVAIIPTEYGSVHFMGYAKDGEFSEFLPVFNDVVRSATFSENSKYKPRLTDRLPLWMQITKWEDVLKYCLVGAAFTFFGKRKLTASTRNEDPVNWWRRVRKIARYYDVFLVVGSILAIVLALSVEPLAKRPSAKYLT